MDIDDLLPRSRTPADYLRVVDDPRLGEAALHGLAASPLPFMRLAVAGQARASAATLLRVLAGDFDRWDRDRLLFVVAGHPRADRAVLLVVLAEVSTMLRKPQWRPYPAPAVLALAGRTDLRPEEFRAVANLPGVSRRLRRDLTARLAARETAPGMVDQAHERSS